MPISKLTSRAHKVTTVRDGEAGGMHHPEFNLFVCCRTGWDHHQLMAEVDELLQLVLGTPAGERLTYAAVFERHAGVDVFSASHEELVARVEKLGVLEPTDLERDDLLNLLLTHVVEPQLGRDQPTFIHDYPASQASLARVRQDEPPVAERFEVFSEGVELANGYHELRDPAEQRRRFEADNTARRAAGSPVECPRT